MDKSTIKKYRSQKELTDEWQTRGMKVGLDYAILTNEITNAWAGRDIKACKKLKGLKKENLRDNMTNLELVLNMLAEDSTTKILKEKLPHGLEENKRLKFSSKIYQPRRFLKPTRFLL